MKRKLIFLSLLISFAICLQSFVYAGNDNKAGKHSKGIKDKFFKNMKMIWMNQDDLGITAEQLKKIKTLKIDTKKDLIRKSADIDIIKIDIHSELWEDTIDVKKVNKLIDKKYNIKKEKSKSIVKAYVSLKELLTDEQKIKMKSLKKKCMSMPNTPKCMKQCLRQ